MPRDANLTRANVVHVVPVGDLVEHDTAGGDCVCVPTATFVESEVGGPDGWLLTHHSLDGREADEPKDVP